MKRKLLRFGKGFRLALRNKRSQAAEMVLTPGETEGGPTNNHRESDQWLYVVKGRGIAIINQKEYLLRTGTLILIERGEKHEIRATGTTLLRTLNIYVPPAYRNRDTALPSGQSS